MRYRHKKRGTEYELLGFGKMQAERWFEPLNGSGPAFPLDSSSIDMREVADAGINYAIERLCEALGVDPRSISWDAATETMDGDVVSVICNVLRAAYGEKWSTKPEDTARIRAALDAALNPGGHDAK